MQGIKLKCTLDGTEYKEYEAFWEDQSLGVIAWRSDSGPSLGNWYTVASDGAPHYFQTQEAVIDFLKGNQLQSPLKRLGNYLVEADLVTPAQIDTALADQATSGIRLGEILAARGWITQKTIEYLMEKVILPERAQ